MRWHELTAAISKQWNVKGDAGTEVRATTPHGSYTFTVSKVGRDERGRVTLWLEEIERRVG